MGLALAGLSATALVLCASASAEASSFQKDETPLPASVTGATVEKAAEETSSGSGGSLVRMFVGLAIVVAVIYGVYWLLKTYGKSKREAGSDGRMAVIATTALAQNRAVHLLRVGDELILVGSAETGVTPIRVYSDDEARRLVPYIEGTVESPFTPTGDPAKLRGMARAVDVLRQRTARA
jgi:flagellar protein FliO/FliZ